MFSWLKNNTIEPFNKEACLYSKDCGVRLSTLLKQAIVIKVASEPFNKFIVK